MVNFNFIIHRIRRVNKGFYVLYVLLDGRRTKIRIFPLTRGKKKFFFVAAADENFMNFIKMFTSCRCF